MGLRSVVLAAAFIRGSLASYDESRALEFAKFAGAAYCSQKSLESWSCGSKCSAAVSDVTVCPGETSQAFVGMWEGKCLVSFQGTKEHVAFITDAKFWQNATSWDICSGCHVHSGFLSEYSSFKNCVQKALVDTGCSKGSQIRTTGHSLGAGVNSIAMLDLTNAGWHVEESYDFGKPRTGDSTFAATYNKLFSGKAWRVTHAMDPVPQVPPDRQLFVDFHYEHTEPEIYYKGDVSEGYQKCTEAHDDTKCAEQYWNVPIDLLHIPDHLDYMGVHTGSDGCEDGEASSTAQMLV